MLRSLIQYNLPTMNNKKSSGILYYIFWIFVPVLAGIFLVWGGVFGINNFSLELFKDGQTYVFSASENVLAMRELTEGGGSEKTYELALAGAALASKDEEIIEEEKKEEQRAEDIEVSALSFLVGDLDTGEVILEKNAGLILPIASITKLITALVSLNTLDQNTAITISETAIKTFGTTGGLKVGERMTLGTLMYPLLLVSSNDAAEAIARSDDRGGFLEMMNSAVLAMGAYNTKFNDASGLSPKNISTANDLFKIARYIYGEKREIFDMTLKQSYSAHGHKWVNPTYFLKTKSYIGGKNGFTDEAEKTGVSLFRMSINGGDERNIAVIILKSKDRNKDASAIIKYLDKKKREK